MPVLQPGADDQALPPRYRWRIAVVLRGELGTTDEMIDPVDSSRPAHRSASRADSRTASSSAVWSRSRREPPVRDQLIA